MKCATLSERRASDRAKMAAELARIVEEAGGTATVGPCSYAPHRLDVAIKVPGGAYVTVDFDGKSCQPAIYVYCWNIELDSDSRFSDAWGWNAVNPFHHSKVQRVSYGFAALCDQITADVRLCVSGLAYSEERKAAHIAKDGTAAERAARFATWQAELAASPL